jgi:leucyl-tRNA synthetase
MLQADTFELVCQVNGKVRARVSAPSGSDAAELERLAREAPVIRSYLDGHDVVKVVTVPDKLVNFVVKPR